MKVFYKARRNEDCPKMINDITQMGYQHCCTDSSKLMSGLEADSRGQMYAVHFDGEISARVLYSRGWGAVPTKMCPYCGHVHEAVELTD